MFSIRYKFAVALDEKPLPPIYVMYIDINLRRNLASNVREFAITFCQFFMALHSVLLIFVITIFDHKIFFPNVTKLLQRQLTAILLQCSIIAAQY